MEWISLLMFAVVCVVLLFGYPVAFSLAGTALVFAYVGEAQGWLVPGMIHAIPSRIFGIMNNATLLAVPLFVFMGVTLERAKIAEDMLESMGMLFGKLSGGLGISVAFVGMLLAASTGIVGATVVTMGLLSLPAMLRRGYDPSLASGIICASGTLGQIIPPSIVLILLGDVLSSAFQKAQSKLGVLSPESVSVGDLFMGALIPGVILVFAYMTYVAFVAWRHPEKAPAITQEKVTSKTVVAALKSLIAPIVLILSVLGSILMGWATSTEAAAVGAVGALLLAVIKKELTIQRLKEINEITLKTSSMVFMILIGASIFSLVFRAYQGDLLIEEVFHNMPGGVIGAMSIVMLVTFLLGFILDFIEITFVVVPIVAPALLMMGIDPVWLGIMFAINLQTSFLTPPFGFSLFYLRGVAPAEVTTRAIYKGVVPFIAIQILMLICLSFWPDIATWLPHQVYTK
ncbi:MAG TPA: TRAP transporter large permease subunit [Aeromonadales bacterium]|nr:TRAP transporter large permease subunit [Aeromonadales bacterium]